MGTTEVCYFIVQKVSDNPLEKYSHKQAIQVQSQTAILQEEQRTKWEDTRRSREEAGGSLCLDTFLLQTYPSLQKWQKSQMSSLT